jgi:hypothetical protein
MTTLRGPIKVSTDSEPPFHEQDGVVLNRNVVRKTFSGPATGTSEAQMIAARTPDPGSAAYVAMELFTGMLDGRQGTFVMQHNGIVANGKPELSVVIIPGTGTGQLAGITGTLTIDNTAGDHSYVFEYELP